MDAEERSRVLDPALFRQQHLRTGGIDMRELIRDILTTLAILAGLFLAFH
jgi:hypothetical protein